MALIICSNCGKQYSDRAGKCPQCGSPCPAQLVDDIKLQSTLDSIKVNDDLIPSNPVEGTSPQPSIETSSIKVDSKKKKSNVRLIILLVIGLFLMFGFVAGWFYYKNIYLPKKRDAEAPRYYVIASSVRMRSTPEFEADYNTIESFPYATEIIVFDSLKDNWYLGKYAPADATGKVVKDKCIEGYIAYKYLMTKPDFFLMNSIFGNDNARKMLSESRYKKALLNYYKEHHYRGDLSDAKIKEYGIDSTLATAERWQVFCKIEKSSSNNVYRSKKYNKYSKYPDAAIIIQNLATQERRLLYYTFDDDETPHLLIESEAPEFGYMKDGTLRLFEDYGRYYVSVEFVL